LSAIARANDTPCAAHGELVEAAAETVAIPARSLFGATDDLGVRCQHGQWWLPGRPSEALF